MRRVLVWVVAGAAVLVLAGYLGLAWYTTTRIADGVVIGGVDVAGKDAAEAERALRAAHEDARTLELRLKVGEQTSTSTAADLGLGIDYKASVDPVTGFTLDPREIWRRLRGGEDHDLVMTANRRTLTTELEALATATRADPVDGTIAFADGAIVRTEPVPGIGLDLAAAPDELRGGWLAAVEEKREIALPTTSIEPAIDTDDLDRFTSEFAEPAIVAPVTIVVGGTPVPLAPAAITPSLKVEAKDGALVGSVDGAAAAAALVAPGTGVGAAAENARFEIRDGAVTIVPSKNGVNVDPAAAGEALQRAIAAPDRQAAIEVVSTEPEITTAELEGAGVKEVVSEFSTNLSGSPGRIENIRIASQTVNGTYLAPGQTFSLNKALGRRTADKGYNSAPVISGGRLRMGTGGGVSQVATTLFNGMFFAGLKDVEHKPHSFYISRYPEGREATVNYPNVDLKFTNDSPHGVLIEMWVADGKVHTRFWSTKVWEIESVKGSRTNLRPPKTINDAGPDCVAQSPSPGFNVVVTRIFRQGGAEKRREQFRTTYIAEDRVVCGP